MVTCMCSTAPAPNYSPSDPVNSVQKFLDSDLLPSSEAEKILTGGSVHEHISRLSADGGGTEPADRGDVARVLEAAAGLH